MQIVDAQCLFTKLACNHFLVINYSIILLMNNIHYKQYNQCSAKFATPIAYCVHHSSIKY